MRTVRHAALMVVIAVLVASCGSGGDTGETTTTTAAATTTTAAATTTTTAATTTTTTLDLPPATATVTFVQIELKELGFFNGDVDGINGPVTSAAIRAFQEDVGINVDGEYGPETGSALAKAVQVDVEFVTGVQKSLKEIGLYSGPADGKYGSGTIAAVKALQKQCDLDQDGRFTVLTHICLDGALKDGGD